MKMTTSLLSKVLSTLLAVAWLGTAAQAQTARPVARLINPEDSDPGYAARKARLAATTASVAPRATTPRQTEPTGPSLLPSCFEPLDATYTALPANDDGSTGLIPLGFTFSLFGTNYTSCYVNNNGNITFDNPLGSFTSSGFPIAEPMVAAFWGDVDTSIPGSGLAYYKVFADRMVITWDRVACFGTGSSALTNTFQIIIRRNTGGFSPSPDVSFSYGDMQWTTGTASGGANGFGGVPATVGVNQGGGNFIQTGRFNVNDATPPQASYPTNAVDFSGVNWLDERCVGYTIAASGNLPPTATGFPTNNTLTLTVGQTANLALQFAGPEIGQTTTVVPDLTGLCNSSAPVGSGGSPIVSFSVTGAACNLGTRNVTFTATDDGTPVRSAVFTLTVTVLPVAVQWTGATNSVYNLNTNWSGGVVPGAADNVAIPATGVNNFPLLTTAAAATNFTVANGASMTIGTGGTLTLTGNLTNNGTFQGTAGILRATGAAAQTFDGTGSGLVLGELNVGSAGVSLGTALDMTRLLTLTGNLTTNGQTLRLLSSASGTAMVVNNGSATVSGNAVVQRYIDPSLNAGLGYRHFSSPVTGATVASLARTGFTPVVNAEYNTLGNTVTPFPNVFGYNETRVNTSGNAGSTDFDRGFFSPGATSDVLTTGKGYVVNTTAALPAVSFTGPLQNGSVPSGVLSRGTATQSGWHLLGNPYPAPLDWDLVVPVLSNLENAVYVFKSSGQYAGSYASYVNGVGTTRFLPVAQAFFVRATSNSASMNLTNAQRVSTYLNPTFNRAAPGTADQRPQLRLDLAVNGQEDAAYVYFENGATTAFDARYDARKLPGGSPLYFATGTTSQPYSINGLPALTAAGVAVPLLTYLPQAGSFTLRLGDQQHFGTASLQLEDRQTGIWHDLRQATALSFQASQPDAAATRFVLHVNQSRPLATQAAVLPAEAVSVWPNPASGVVSLQVSALPAAGDVLQLTLLNVLGQVAARQTVDVRAGSAATTIDVRSLAPGVYTLKGNTRTHTFTRSLVVE